MPTIPRRDSLPIMIKVANLFGGRLKYEASNNGGPGAYVRFGEAPFHVDIHKGDSIVKKGSKAVVTSIYMKKKIAYLKKYPEMHHMISRFENSLKQSFEIEKSK